MNNAKPATPAADQEIDARLAVVQEAVSTLANPIPILEDIEAELDILAGEEADPEALDAIHNNAITLLDSQQRLATAFMTTLELAKALKDQREQARQGLAELKQAIDDADRDVPEVESLWQTIEEIISEENEMYLWDMMYEVIDDQIAFGSGLSHTEAAALTNLLTGGCFEDDHPLWDELRDWIRRAEKASMEPSFAD
jgi:hypothetical protein